MPGHYLWPQYAGGQKASHMPCWQALLSSWRAELKRGLSC